jgi:hypothetical protein
LGSFHAVRFLPPRGYAAPPDVLNPRNPRNPRIKPPQRALFSLVRHDSM